MNGCSHSHTLSLNFAQLILYGEEATKQAQKEGEEAAAAYEKEKRDIAAGIIPEPSPSAKPPKKKPPKKEKGEAAKKRKSSTSAGAGNTSELAANEGKKAKTNTKACKLEKEAIGSTVAKGVTKASILASRETFDNVSDKDLMAMASTRLKAAQGKIYCVTDVRSTTSTIETWFRPCIPINNQPDFHPWGAAMLIGLRPNWFGWDLQEFVSSQETVYDPITAIQMLAVEFDEGGVNEKFQCLIQGSRAVLGRASELTQSAYKSLGLGQVPLGGACGKIDCHIGGVPHSCGETAACIYHHNAAPESLAGDQTQSDFYLRCLSDVDIVTLNGQKITPSSGSCSIFDEDVITIGPRVFSFIKLTTTTEK